MGALQDLDDAAHRIATPRPSFDPGDHLIAIHSRGEVSGRHVNVLVFATFMSHEPVAGANHGQPTGHEFDLLRDRVSPALDPGHSPVTLESGENILEGAISFRRDTQLAGQLFGL
jgi:hypothetical protein